MRSTKCIHAKKTLIFSLLALLIPTKIYAQEPGRYIARDGSEVTYSREELAKKLPVDIKPLLNYTIRDASICTGPDSTYYLTYWVNVISCSSA